MKIRLSPVALAVRAVVVVSVAAALPAGFVLAAEPAEDTELAPVYVYATAIEEDPARIASSFNLLEGDQLFERTQATLGETLNGLPGVHADTFGGGSARPVVRGQTAPRVTVLSDSSALLDASDISPDHAVTAEPLLLERIEVLRGPAALLYGSGAIGGVVNLIDGKVPTTLPAAGLEGRAALRGSTAAGERAIAGALTARATSKIALHLEGTLRRAEDYRARGLEESRVDGTWADSGSVSAGASWIADNGYLGLAYTYRDDDYGVPGHEHEYASCHPHGSSLHCGGHEAEPEDPDHDHEHEHEAPPQIALRSDRVDLRGEWRTAGFAERVRLRASHTDYQHDELEEDEVGTAFRNDGWDARLELQHRALGPLRGVMGVQHSDSRFRSVGAEAFLPTVKSQSTGLFLVEHLELTETWHLEFGARQEWTEHRPVNDPRARPAFDDSATSFSGALVWQVVPGNYLTLSAASSQRLPHAQELYARGVHLATNTYECGLLPSAQTCGGAVNDAPFATETSRNWELGWRRTTGAFTFQVNAFRNRVEDYTYARTLDQFEDFRLIKYAQRNARFQGGEVEATWAFSPALSATLFGDLVHARFADGEDLPRIPASRIGARVNASIGPVGAELEYFHVNEQDRIAAFETVTPGHDMVNLTLRQRLQGTGVSWYLRGTNLLDERVWNHSSFLADVVPLQRRGVGAGVSYTF